ncbi:hypothetical protein Q1695_004199 [Nippostrongylus brasiliensis]|nr:hypothetical protein Q1695_004199 [Nippostrongylus brasiliensis]
MIQSADEVQAGSQSQAGSCILPTDDDCDEVASVGLDNQCESEFFSTETGSFADIDDVADEVEVKHIDVEEWDQQPQRPKSLVPANVLMTNDSLRGRPQLFVGSGTSIQNREASAMQWGDPGEIPGTSSDSQRMPGMKSIFKMYGEAAVRKASQAVLMDTADGRPQKNDDKPPSYEYDIGEDGFDPLVEEAVESDFVGLDPGQIYSKRKQVLHMYEEWPLYWDRPVDFQEACCILTGAVSVHESKICSSIPQGFRGEGTFVINCEQLNRSEANNDGLGAWGRPTGRNRYYGHSTSGLFTRMDDGRGNLLPGAKYIWKCMMKRYEHPMTASVKGGQNRFIKKVHSALYPPDRRDMVSLIVITYEWIGKPFNFRCNPTSARKGRISTAPHPPPGTKDWQAASFQNGVLSTLPATCSAYFDDCPLYAVGAIDFNAVASIILGGTIVEPSKLCHRVPQGYRESGTFIIDLCNFYSDAEVRRDNNGCWGKPAGNSRYYKIDPNTGDAVRVDRGCKLIEGAEFDVQILSKRYEHPSVGGRFVRKIYTAKSPTGSRAYESCLNLAVLTYYWKGEPEYFEAGPQRRVRIPEGFGRPRPLDGQYLSHSGQDRERTMSSPPPKRLRAGGEDEDSADNVQSTMYRTEYELLERQASILDRFEAFMDRLERISMCLPQIQEPVQQARYSPI